MAAAGGIGKKPKILVSAKASIKLKGTAISSISTRTLGTRSDRIRLSLLIHQRQIRVLTMMVNTDIIYPCTS